MPGEDQTESTPNGGPASQDPGEDREGDSGASDVEQEQAGGSSSGLASRITRRHLVIAGGVAAVGLVGAQFVGDPSGRLPTTPTSVIEMWTNAVGSGNMERAKKIIHPDSPNRESLVQWAKGLEGADITVSENTVMEQQGDEARIRISLSYTSDSSMGFSDTSIVVRKSNDTWHLWGR